MGNQANINALVADLLTPLGLGSLAQAMLGWIKNGYTIQTAMLKLQERPEYKQRFAANDQRKKRGLAPLDPASYIQVENDLRSTLRRSGLPAGFYDSAEDITRFIANDISPAELQARAKAAYDTVNSKDPATLEAFKRFYGLGTGHLAAYMLDPNRSFNLLEKQMKGAQIGAEAVRAGIGFGTAGVEGIADAGIGAQEARKAFQTTAQEWGILAQEATATRTNLTKTQVAMGELDMAPQAAEKTRQLKSQIRGRFSGQGGGVNSLAGGSMSGSI